MKIIKAGIEDAASILELQKLAYLSEAEIYDDFSIPPLVQTSEEIKKEFGEKTVLKAIIDNRLVGSVRAREQDGTCHIDRLIVHPKYQDNGIGKRLMAEIETVFPSAKRFELFTGHKSERNLYLYRKLGYQTFKQKPFNEKLSFVFLEKVPR
jgi:ribosomal protein S18 acetylase RimI-like enzyme